MHLYTYTSINSYIYLNETIKRNKVVIAIPTTEPHVGFKVWTWRISAGNYQAASQNG